MRSERMALAALMSLVLVGGCLAGSPSFRSAPDKNAASFKAEVFETIVKKARLHPGSITLEKSSYADIDTDRKELTLTGTYKGAILKSRYEVTLVIRLDTTDAKAWKVQKITYSDNNKAPRPAEKIFAALAKQLSE